MLCASTDKACTSCKDISVPAPPKATLCAKESD